MSSSNNKTAFTIPDSPRLYAGRALLAVTLLGSGPVNHEMRWEVLVRLLLLPRLI